MLTIKTQLNTGDIRRFTVDHCDNLTPSVLIGLCLRAHTHPFSHHDVWDMFWEDPDGDLVTIECQRDLDQAILECGTAGVLKVFVWPREHTQPPELALSSSGILPATGLDAASRVDGNVTVTPLGDEADTFVMVGHVPTAIPPSPLLRELAAFDKTALKSTRLGAKVGMDAERGAQGHASTPQRAQDPAQPSDVRNVGGDAIRVDVAHARPPPRLTLGTMPVHAQMCTEVCRFNKQSLRTVKVPPALPRQSSATTDARTRLLDAIRTAAPLLKAKTMRGADPSMGCESHPCMPPGYAKRWATIHADIKAFSRRPHTLNRVIPNVLHPAQVRHRHRTTTLRQPATPPSHCIEELASRVKAMQARREGAVQAAKVQRAVLNTVPQFPVFLRCLRPVTSTSV
eukprot:m.16109 g.16109  ORF g.16109 m.16109 type:complete len:399 (+) comp3353_c0_seq2:265-1461(+)